MVSGSLSILPGGGVISLGDIVARGMAGNQQYGYGRPRGFCDRNESSASPMAAIIKVGGRVVKNVAGYDLCKLFTGSCGTLGMITGVELQLRPLPDTEQTIVAIGDPFELIRSARTLLDARLFPVAMELVSSSFAKELDIESPEGQCVLLVRYAGTRKGVDWQSRRRHRDTGDESWGERDHSGRPVICGPQWPASLFAAYLGFHFESVCYPRALTS